MHRTKTHNQIILEDEMFWQNKSHMFDKIYGTIKSFLSKKRRIEATDSDDSLYKTAYKPSTSNREICPH